jgi:hypothetical protein
MDPDLVRQQEEAEREALAALAKKTSTAAGKGVADSAPGFAPLFFNHDNAIPPLGKSALPPWQAAGMADSGFARLGRFMSFGLAGGMLGGSAGIMAANYWQLPMEQANLAIFGPAGALAMFCATASLFVGRPQPPQPARR